MAKWRVHPTDRGQGKEGEGCKSWQSGGYIQREVYEALQSAGCKSWQSGGYIQQTFDELKEICRCKSWQSGGYIQLYWLVDNTEMAVSHDKMESTPNVGRTEPMSRVAVCHGKMVGR